MRKSVFVFAAAMLAAFPASSATAQDTVKIGLILPYSGQFADAAAQMDNASANSFLGGAFGLGGQLGAASIMSFSDRRLKVDAKKVGKFADLNVYRYRYAGGSDWHIGFMADEVKKVYPGAVKRHANGFDMVDYSMIGA